ncbi:MAG: PD-(D/E)XK nuclease family protein [Nitrososphaerales archaeon]
MDDPTGFTHKRKEGHIWLTPSDVWSYAVCPWLVYYRRVLRKYSYESSPGMAVGSFEHEVRRRISCTVPEVNNLQMAAEVAGRCVNEGYEYAVRNFEAFPFSLALAQQNMMSNVKAELHDIMNNPPYAVELSVSSERLGLAGRIDCLYRSRNTYIPCDYKTGLGAENYHRANVLQVTTYALVLEDGFNCKVPCGIVHYTTLGRKCIFNVTSELRKEVQVIIAAIRNMILTRQEPRVEPLGLQHCSRCQHRPTCEIKARRNL